MDKLPNAIVLKENEGEYIIDTHMFGKGIKMWLLSQGDYVEVLSPASFREDVAKTISRMKDKYDE